MHPELQQTLSQFANVQSLDIKKVSRFTPADFRHGIQWLLAEDNPDLAQVLAEAGLGIYPQSEDILAIAGLLASLPDECGAPPAGGGTCDVPGLYEHLMLALAQRWGQPVSGRQSRGPGGSWVCAAVAHTLDAAA